MKEVIGNGENKLISVLIPIYNTEKFLAECLESIINQTYKNIEILCADDGSTDASAEIIREYARKDSRIIPIFEGRNGVSKTRNILLEAAKGEIIYFIDSTQKDINGDGINDINGVTRRQYNNNDKRFKAFGKMRLMY